MCVQLGCSFLSGVSITFLKNAYGSFTLMTLSHELLVAAFVPPVEESLTNFVSLCCGNRNFHVYLHKQTMDPFATGGPFDVHFGYSHSTAKTPWPHPSSGESSSPPLGGAIAMSLLRVLAAWTPPLRSREAETEATARQVHAVVPRAK